VPSSELLICKECGQSFDTVESLGEHMKSEKDEIKNRVKGFSDGHSTVQGAFFTTTITTITPAISPRLSFYC
jgi:hypothetical protein